MRGQVFLLSFISILWVFSPASVYALNTCSQVFVLATKSQAGGFVTLKDGSMIEGSRINGGLQPHSKIDFKHPSLAELLEGAHSIRNLDTLTKIKLITEAAHRTLTNNTYTDPTYLGVMKKAMEESGTISFGEYIKNKSGTCRENAIFMHLALQAAGVPNKLTYSLYTHFNFDRKAERLDTVTEDHAFVVVTWEGQNYIVDSYFHEAHGLSLDAISKNKTIDRNTPRAPWAYDLWSQVPASLNELPVHIERIHSFPNYHNID